ncbi:MAG: zinc-binding dehydrogenase [Halobacteriales archaeon]
MQGDAIVMTEPGQLERRTIDVPEPGPEEALLRVELNGICGTDVHMNEGGMDLEFPVVPGHEFAGVLEEVGADLDTDATGDPVSEGNAATVVPAYNATDDWYTRNMPTRPLACTDRRVCGFRSVEQHPHAHGGMSEYLLVEAENFLYRLPDDMDVERGALVEPTAVATHALERAFRPGIPHVREGFGMGKSVAVQGAGPVGLLTAAAARHAGAGQVIVVDLIEDRLAMAEAFGATDTVDISAHDDEADLFAAVKERTSGGVGPDVVIEAVGQPVAFRQALQFVHDAGTVIEVGHYADAGTVEINPTDIVQKELDIHGSLAYPPTQFETAISMLDELEDVPLTDLFNHRVGFDAVESAYEAQAAGEAYRATIHPGK